MGISSFLGRFGRKRSVTDDEKTALLQQHLIALEKVLSLTLVNICNIDIKQPKARLAAGLFMMGATDAASQAADLNEQQFIALALDVLTELGYDDESRLKIISFHQSPMDQNQLLYSAIMKGGQCYVEGIGNPDAVIEGGVFLKKLIDDSIFPSRF